MPVDPSKKAPVEILEIPAGATPAQLTDLMNDRIRSINALVKGYLQNPAIGAADLGQFQIINLADPKNDLDGVNLRTLRKFGGTGSTQQETGGSGERPTIYFTLDGLVFDGEVSPYAIILANRVGFSLTAVGLSAVGAPTSEPLSINLQIGGTNLLGTDAQLPVGQNGPVIVKNFLNPPQLALGTLIQAIINSGGGATQVTIALSLQGAS